MMKKLLLESAIPARALYQATKAVRRPKKPPALIRWVCGWPWGSWKRYPTPSMRKVISRKKNSRKKATVDRKVQKRRMVLKMNQP